jgi:serine/threonine protein phosphatase PrpC
MIQTSHKIYLAWVGDCHTVLCKKERKFQAVKLTGKDVIHTPESPYEMRRIYLNKGEVRTG